MDQADRETYQSKLSSSKVLEHSQGNCFFHGRVYSGPGADEAPAVTWESKVLPRDDHGSTADWLTATEYCDHSVVIDAKCAQLARMIQLSQKTVVYSGAGISVPALIGQAAKGSSGSGSKSSDAFPTKTHFALGALGRHGLLHGWVQQNHDGLPQKAGFPQESINEIHGSWFDPSNPVVLYSGTLKGDAYPQMIHDADTADLVIVVGTSLGGLNADQVANKTAKRSLRNKPWKPDGSGGALGTVIINLQQTEQDGKASLRLFGTTDTVLPRVLEKLGLAECSPNQKGEKFVREPNGYMYADHPASRDPNCWTMKLLDASTGKMEAIENARFLPNNRKALVPYDAEGRRLKDGDDRRMVLDLSNGAGVKITDGHNIQGAGQPAYLHIGASKPYTRPKAYGGQTLQNGPGHGKVHAFSSAQSCFQLQIEGVTMSLGAWWLEAAERGALETLPVVNLKPVFKTTVKEEAEPTTTSVTAAGGSHQPSTTAAPPQPLSIEVGNTAVKASSGDNWKWMIYVQGEGVVETTFHLHPTFTPADITVRSDGTGCCSLERTGWGTFDISCDIKLRDGRIIQKVHSLVFHPSGSSQKYQI